MVDRNHARYIKLDADTTAQIVRRYLSGENREPIARSLGYTRRLIERVLEEHGVRLRSATETNRLSMSKRTPEENRRNTEAAHEAVRGSRRSLQDLRKRALMVERHSGAEEPRSQLERKFFQLARESGLRLIPQKSIKIYNVDFLIEGTPIAVEILSAGGYRIHNPEFAKGFNQRTEDLLDLGYCLIMIWATDCLASQRRWRVTPIERGCVEKAISLTDIFRLDPTRLREQYVILGNGKPTALASNYFDYSSCERRLRHR